MNDIEDNVRSIKEKLDAYENGAMYIIITISVLCAIFTLANIILAALIYFKVI